MPPRGDNQTEGSPDRLMPLTHNRRDEGEGFPRWSRGEDRHSAKLTEAQVMEIRARHSDGATLKSLAESFPQCSKPNLHHIINGRRWRYLLATEAR